MIAETKIAKVRKKIRNTIGSQKMYIENEPPYTGHPNNTIARDDQKTGAKNERKKPKQK